MLTEGQKKQALSVPLQVWLYVSVIPAPRRLRQEDCERKTSLGYISLGSIVIQCLKKTKPRMGAVRKFEFLLSAASKKTNMDPGKLLCGWPGMTLVCVTRCDSSVGAQV